MKRMALCAATLLAMAAVAHADSTSSSSSASSNGQSTSVSGPNKNCKVVHAKPPTSGNGAMSSSVSAGPNGVSGYTTGGGITTQSGSGSGSNSMSSSTSDGRTVVTSSNGDCTIYLDPDKNK